MGLVVVQEYSSLPWTATSGLSVSPERVELMRNMLQSLILVIMVLCLIQIPISAYMLYYDIPDKDEEEAEDEEKAQDKADKKKMLQTLALNEEEKRPLLVNV